MNGQLGRAAELKLVIPHELAELQELLELRVAVRS